MCAGHEMYDSHTTMGDVYDAHKEQMSASHAACAKQQAKRWRDDNGYNGKGGVIVVYGNEVQGWVNELRNPEHWQPGCIAVTEDGACYEAAGGNDYHGAKYWQPCA